MTDPAQLLLYALLAAPFVVFVVAWALEKD